MEGNGEHTNLILIELKQTGWLQFLLAILGVVTCLCFDSLETLKMTINNPLIFQENSVICVQYFYFNAVSFGGVFSNYFMAIFAALPFAASYSIEQQYGVLNYKIARSSKKSYFASKIIVAALIGGSVVLIGSIVFILILSTYLPLTTPAKIYEMTGLPYSNALTVGNGLSYFAIVLYLAFLTGVLWSSVGMCISAFLPNPYVAVCSPMIFQFLLVELGRLLRLPNSLRMDMLLCARGTIYSDTITPIATTVLIVLLLYGFYRLFSKRCERRLENAE